MASRGGRGLPIPSRCIAPPPPRFRSVSVRPPVPVIGLSREQRISHHRQPKQTQSRTINQLASLLGAGPGRFNLFPTVNLRPTDRPYKHLKFSARPSNAKAVATACKSRRRYSLRTMTGPIPCPPGIAMVAILALGIWCCVSIWSARLADLFLWGRAAA